jgi:hypothetical protein
MFPKLSGTLFRARGETLTDASGETTFAAQPARSHDLNIPIRECNGRPVYSSSWTRPTGRGSTPSPRWEPAGRVERRTLLRDRRRSTGLRSGGASRRRGRIASPSSASVCVGAAIMTRAGGWSSTRPRPDRSSTLTESQRLLATLSALRRRPPVGSLACRSQVLEHRSGSLGVRA